jgi:hypothetical protein
MIKLIKIWNRKDISQFRCYTYIEREREDNAKNTTQPRAFELNNSYGRGVQEIYHRCYDIYGISLFFLTNSIRYYNIQKPKGYIVRNEGHTPHTLKSERSDLKNNYICRISNFTKITINPLTKKILVKLEPHISNCT